MPLFDFINGEDIEFLPRVGQDATTPQSSRADLRLPLKPSHHIATGKPLCGLFGWVVAPSILDAETIQIGLRFLCAMLKTQLCGRHHPAMFFMLRISLVMVLK